METDKCLLRSHGKFGSQSQPYPSVCKCPEEGLTPRCHQSAAEGEPWGLRPDEASTEWGGSTGGRSGTEEKSVQFCLGDICIFKEERPIKSVC